MRAAAAALAVTFLLATGAGTAAASSPQDAVVAFSDGGDWIGRGYQQIWRGSDAQIYTTTFDDGAVSVWATGGPTGSSAFDFRFSPPPGQQLTPGVYTDAQRYPTDGHAAIDIGGSGHGCNTTRGSFEIRDIGRDELGKVNRLWLVYEQHCDGGLAATWGEIRVGEPASADGIEAWPAVVRWPAADHDAQRTVVPVTVQPTAVPAQITGATIVGADASSYSILDDSCTAKTVAAGSACQLWVKFAPGDAGTRQAALRLTDAAGGRRDIALQGWSYGGTTHFHMTGDPGDWITGGRTYDLTPANARMLAGGNHNHLSMSITAVDGQWWNLDISPPDGDILRPGTFAPAYRDAFRNGGAGLEVTGSGHGCNQINGSYTIDAIDWLASGQVRSFTLSFEQRCDTTGPAARGTVQWRAGDTATAAPWMSPASQPTAIANPDSTPSASTATPAAGMPAPVSTATATPTGAGAIDGASATKTPAVKRAGRGVKLTFLGSSRAGALLRFSAKLPAAGTLSIKTTAKPRSRHAAMTLGGGKVTAGKAQTKPLTVRLSAQTIRSLRGLRSVRITTYVTWRPRGGKATTSRATALLKLRR